MGRAVATSAATRLSRKREAWARGAREAAELDRARAREMSHEERIAQGLALIRIAEKLQAGQRDRSR